MVDAQSTNEETLTENLAFAEVLAWSTTRPAWQRDALRRLVQNQGLDAEAIDELLEICLDPTLPHTPLSDADVSSQTILGSPVSVLRIENPTGVNALAFDQKLEFAQTGLSIVYGDNGSGKSGYVRILKHACRTRDRNITILRDVEDAAATPQKANIVFLRGATEDEFAWSADAPSHADLPSISIFDSRSANVHVEKTNAVAYIPQPMRVLEALASACDQLKAKLDDRLADIDAKTPLAIKSPQLQIDTAAGAFVHNLSAKSSVAQLDLLAQLSDAETAHLATIESDLAQDPKRAAAKITSQEARLDDAISKLKNLVDAASPAAFATRAVLKSEWETKADSAKLASSSLFAASPLPDVGKATWRALWEAARKYSDEVAYPTRTFPHPTGHDELCVLCQQPMGYDAVARQITFESFVKGSTKADEEAAEKAHSDALKKAAGKGMNVGARRQFISLVANEIGDAALAASLKACCIQAAWRLRALLRGAAAPGQPAMVPENELATLSAGLATRAQQLSADQNSPEHLALVKEFRELKDREALGPLLADIKAEIERRKKAEVIAKSAKDTAKRSVTTKNKELSDKLVTNALRGRFAREIDKLKLARMPVELRKVKDSNAVSYFQVCLVEKPDEPVGEIFSEGEHRCVALAAFLAELVTSKQYSSIVFDDPMSSLDHIHRKAVAARLIEEAEHQQVIVFTHDLTFLFELRREADAKARPVSYQTVCRKQSRPGFVEAELPMKAKSAQQLAHALRSELKAAKYQFDSWPDARRTIFSKGIIEQLRESWDQGIADFVFPVLARFDNAIKGNSLFKLAIITDDDVKTVTAARGRLSEEMHIAAETLNPDTVSHADLVAEVVKLETWLASIQQRQKDAKAPVTSYS
ncbi:AAA family ATPase [Rhizobium leguminosarum bv. viciae]|uniref:AAA family ATPase n=1 Tax=Rhizobium leguminosarum TaxID=384 RepID=UPI001441BE11|nr:AAA family ATPase [Rhizobium leguminosarum]MBB4343094.1 energy-coupling factor transporter ATP-binding protein EcfA2 [Rhizobium leguminosarum]MBB6296172.1 energy-coupling factor transporter ATP-binding protein EcfA2 [Rhizobium leguminosarum]NKL72974.1 AAA family ATPase [Rhizobium leguminosarum bv. viciae]